MSGYGRSDKDNVKFAAGIAGVIAFCVAILLALIAAGWSSFSALGRYQDVQHAKNLAHVARIDAANQTLVNELLISANAQQVKIHQQQADIRLADAVGVREAQDEISKTLTPLYVQLQYVDALEKMAESGKNNTLEMIPTGAGGIPLVANVNPNPVTAP